MRKSTLGVAAGLAVAALLMSACGSSDDTSSSSSGAAAASGKVGVILPDTSSSPRWEANDRPYLTDAFDAAGIDSDIQNAEGDVDKFGTICDSMINESVDVLMIVNLDSDSGAACLSKAKEAGIQTIDYDRLTLGGGASYYVSFDNVKVGGLMGDGIQKCLKDEGKTTGVNVVFINGAPTDNNATLFKQGYQENLQPLFDSGDYKLVGDQTGQWDADKAATAFEQIFTQNNGDVDAVVSANDTMAGGVVSILKKNKLNGKVPVTGQDASIEGLQRILTGDQCMTVYKPIKAEADAASALAIAMITGADTGSIVNGTVQDTVAKTDVPSALQTPIGIYVDSVQQVIDDGFWTYDDICTADFKSACDAAGITK